MSVTNTGRALRHLIKSGRLQRVRRGSGPGYPSLYRVVDHTPPANPYREPPTAA